MAYFDFTGRCPCCGSIDLWDDNLTYGCNNPNCRWSKALGPQKKPLMNQQDFERLPPPPTDDEE